MTRVFALLSLIVFAQVTLAFPLPRPGMSAPPREFTDEYNYEGIVQLDNCSGSFVRFENSQDTDRGLILTNGHCLEIGFPDPGEVISGRSSRRAFNLLQADGSRAGTVRADMIVYSTMTGTDMTLYRLRDTYAEIMAKYTVTPLTLSAQHPALESAIEVISGYWVTGFSCSVEAFVYQLREEDYLMTDSIRYSRPGCVVYGGTSGSPVIDTASRQVVGVNNTGNESGERCTMNNPCEIDQDGNVTYVKDYSYGQETYWLYSCLNATREIDLAQQGCLLPH
jgi:V8-like Glu-specific endopeptidase